MHVVVSAAIDSSYVREWADLLVRWLHVVASIAWIGASFYFILLDNQLDAPVGAEDAEAGVMGELWEVHGGGFYHVQKYRVAPRVLPERLAWFKWEAYTTWLSGFALLCIVYFSNARAYLIDRSVADLSVHEAIAISIGLLIVAWLVYDALCRALGRWPKLLALALLGFIGLSAYVAGRLFAPRAMFIEVGSMIGTMMVGNVFFVIIPAHWELIRAKRAGREPDPAPGIKAKLRSVHNNYLTLPVLLAMLSNHFPFVYGHDDAWLVLCAFVVLGVYIRHFFNLRHAGRTRWSMPVVAAAAVLALALWLAPPDTSTAPAEHRGHRRREADLPDGRLQRLPHARGRRRERTRRPQPRRGPAVAGTRDQSRDERPGRDAAVRRQTLAGADRAGCRLRLGPRRRLAGLRRAGTGLPGVQPSSSASRARSMPSASSSSRMIARNVAAAALPSSEFVSM